MADSRASYRGGRGRERGRDRDKDRERERDRERDRDRDGARDGTREQQQQQQQQRRGVVAPISERPLHVQSGDIAGFLDLLGDVLRLPDETIATTHIYMNKYHRWFNAVVVDSGGSPDLPPPPPPPSSSSSSSSGKILLLDEYTLALASLSLSTKSTECPRRLRDILLPAYALLHSNANANSSYTSSSSKNKKLTQAQAQAQAPTAQTPLTYPSHKYDTLRQTLVQAELILLRALGFATYVQTPYEFLPRLVGKVMNTRVYGGGGWASSGGGGGGGENGNNNNNNNNNSSSSIGSGSSSNCGMEDWESYTPAEAEECGVVGLMQTGLGRRSKSWVERAVREYSVVNWYTMRTVAVVCVWLAMREVGWSLPDALAQEHQGSSKEAAGGDRRDDDGDDDDGDDGGNTDWRSGEKRAVGEWVEQLSSGKVDPRDFWEVVAVLERPVGMGK